MKLATRSVSAKTDRRTVKDSPTRSLVKAISWRIMGSASTFLIAFVIFRQTTEKGFYQVLEGASIITIFDFIFKLLAYYIHERLWANISWGKYWTRHYWRRRAWRKLYRQKHNS